jgi:3-hydroxyacyl-[acyl-carrier-protein] dehydratase
MNESTTRRLDVPASHPAFAGHFPGHPILPGVALIAEVLEVARAVPALRAMIGDAPRLAVAKFMAPVQPGARLDIELRTSASGLEFQVRDGAHTAAAGRFALASAAVSA